MLQIFFRGKPQDCILCKQNPPCGCSPTYASSKTSSPMESGGHQYSQYNAHTMCTFPQFTHFSPILIITLCFLQDPQPYHLQECILTKQLLSGHSLKFKTFTSESLKLHTRYRISPQTAIHLWPLQDLQHHHVQQCMVAVDTKYTSSITFSSSDPVQTLSHRRTTNLQLQPCNGMSFHTLLFTSCDYSKTSSNGGAMGVTYNARKDHCTLDILNKSSNTSHGLP